MASFRLELRRRSSLSLVCVYVYTSSLGDTFASSLSDSFASSLGEVDSSAACGLSDSSSDDLDSSKSFGRVFFRLDVFLKVVLMHGRVLSL